MQFGNKEKEIHGLNKRVILYTLCFAFFCLIDQRTKTASGLDGLTETFQNLTGAGMAVVIMSHYRWNDFIRYKLPYLVWTTVSIAGAVPAVLWGAGNRPFMNEWIAAALDVVIFGYILIHTFISVVIEKRRPAWNKKAGTLWFVVMVLMILSRSDYIWPFCYLIMFGCFYLTDYTKEEQEDLFQGILNGIILAFFAFQGLCCVFRPYDVVRYTGIYTNPNLNASFYLEVLAAVFAKIYYVTRFGKAKFWKVFYWLGAGVVYAFLFMTIGRTGWIVSFVLGLLFLVLLKNLQGRRNFIINGIILVLCASLMFPICFGMTRYLPPVFHHPIWFWGEWNEDRVHSWDPWDSEKYIEMNELLETSIGRVTELAGDMVSKSPLALRAYAAEAVVDERYEKAVLKTEEEYTDPFLVRGTIYRHYFENLNFTGHRRDEQGFQLAPRYWVGHAHNIYLQYGTDFGIIMLICFVVLMAWSVISLWKKTLVMKTERMAGYLLFLLIPLLFGMLEFAWGTGSIQILMMFISLRQVICKEGQA